MTQTTRTGEAMGKMSDRKSTSESSASTGSAKVSLPLSPNASASIGALLVGLGVAAGALGTHTLADVLTHSRLQTFEIAARYQVYSGLGVMLLAALAMHGKRVSWATLLVVFGSVVFCGSLYLLVAGAPGFFGAIAPIGGAFMILGWLRAAWQLWRA